VAPRASKPAAAAVPRSVAEYIADLGEPARVQVELVREIILGASPAIGEEIKWNVPSFFTTDHFATLNLRGATGVRVVLHLGAEVRAPEPRVVVADPAGLLTWLSPARAVATFTDLQHLSSVRGSLDQLVREWIAHVER
jgi:hypothetical protein